MDEGSKIGRRKQKVSFSEDLAHMLYAFGDVKSPNMDTINDLEEYLLYFIEEIVSRAMSRQERRDGSNSKISKDDILFLIKNDPKWLARLSYLIQTKMEVDKIQEEAKNQRAD